MSKISAKLTLAFNGAVKNALGCDSLIRAGVGGIGVPILLAASGVALFPYAAAVAAGAVVYTLAIDGAEGVRKALQKPQL